MKFARVPVAVLTIVTIAAVPAGCRDANRGAVPDTFDEIPVDDRPEASSEVDREYAPDLNVDLNAMTRTESGLYIQDIEVGDGPPAEIGRMVEVHYTGWLADGTRFDSSYERNQTYDFVLGTGAVIAGWEEGIAGMRAGGRRRLVIPPSLAYGRDGYGVIPPYATLVFDTELVAVQ
jgi:FKBP-type peptidyl-prolyl cis-trans isomerase FkpA